LYTGRKVEVILTTDVKQWEAPFFAWVAVFIDDEITPYKRFCLTKAEDKYVLYESEEVKTVTVRLVKMSEATFAKVGVKRICIGDNEDLKPIPRRKKTIEFIGDSITCGYGIEGVWNRDTFTTAQENPWIAYAGITARNLDADYHLVSWSGIGVLSSWTEIDEPNTNLLMPRLYQYTDLALEESRHCKELELWDFNRFIPDIIVINLGTNDRSYCKGIKEREEAFGKEYHQFLSYIRSRNRNSAILCTLGAMGGELYSEIEKQVEAFKDANSDPKVYAMSFDVQKNRDGIGSDWHPNMITHGHMAEKLTNKIREIMKW